MASNFSRAFNIKKKQNPLEYALLFGNSEKEVKRLKKVWIEENPNLEEHIVYSEIFKTATGYAVAIKIQLPNSQPKTRQPGLVQPKSPKSRKKPQT